MYQLLLLPQLPQLVLVQAASFRFYFAYQIGIIKYEF